MAFIQHLSLQHFRNYTELSIPLENQIYIIKGDNGIGKTNFIEAIHVLCLTKSFRTHQDNDLVQAGQSFFFIEGLVSELNDVQRIRCNFLKGKGKKIFHDEFCLEKFSEHIGLLPCVSLVPEDTELVKDTAKRRKWLNQLLCQMDKSYLIALQKYEHALLQRNALLKKNTSWNEIEPWTLQLIHAGTTIFQKRHSYLLQLQNRFKTINQELEHLDEPALIYQPNFAYSEPTKDLQHYHKRFSQDIQAQYTTLGCHRDDLHFFIHHKPLKNFGSQGQQKSFIIQLKLTEYLFIEEFQKNCILLLDDLMEKLDLQRTKLFMDFLNKHRKGQVFITTPHIHNFNIELAVLEVQQKGSITVSV